MLFFFSCFSMNLATINIAATTPKNSNTKMAFFVTSVIKLFIFILLLCFEAYVLQIEKALNLMIQGWLNTWRNILNSYRYQNLHTFSLSKHKLHILYYSWHTFSNYVWWHYKPYFSSVLCQIFSSLIQTLLSVLELHQIGRQNGSRTIPPVGNLTLPRRIIIFYFGIITL